MQKKDKNAILENLWYDFAQFKMTISPPTHHPRIWLWYIINSAKYYQPENLSTLILIFLAIWR